MRSRGDELSIIEAAYEGAASAGAWVARLVEVTAPVLDEGMGVFGHSFALNADGSVSMGNVHHAGSASVMLEVLEPLVSGIMRADQGPAFMRRMYPRAPTATTISAHSGFRRGVQEFEKLVGVPPLGIGIDGVGLLGGDPSGHGVVIHSMTRSVVALPPGRAKLLTRVATHIAAGYRLARNPSARVDAVLSPDGRVVHAEGSARGAAERASLGRSMAAIDRARTRLARASPDAALALWRGLVDGRWSLVESIDSDGRRYLFAKRNSPEARPWSRLTVRERQVVAYAVEGQAFKEIAYQLGIGVPTVSDHMKSAAKRVGASSRFELLRAYRAAFGAGA